MARQPHVLIRRAPVVDAAVHERDVRIGRGRSKCVVEDRALKVDSARRERAHHEIRACSTFSFGASASPCDVSAIVRHAGRDLFARPGHDAERAGA